MKLQLAVVNISQSWSLAGDVMIYARSLPVGMYEWQL